jgi:hypothetical protein
MDACCAALYNIPAALHRATSPHAVLWCALQAYICEGLPLPPITRLVLRNVHTSFSAPGHLLDLHFGDLMLAHLPDAAQLINNVLQTRETGVRGPRLTQQPALCADTHSSKVERLSKQSLQDMPPALMQPPCATTP